MPRAEGVSGAIIKRDIGSVGSFYVREAPAIHSSLVRCKGVRQHLLVECEGLMVVHKHVKAAGRLPQKWIWTMAEDSTQQIARKSELDDIAQLSIPSNGTSESDS